MTVHSLYTLYMEDCKTRLKPTTYANKDFLFQKHVLPYLGNLQASSVGPADIRKWQNTLLSAKKEGANDPYSQTYLKDRSQPGLRHVQLRGKVLRHEK